MIKYLAKLGRKTNLKNVGSQIHPRWKYLLNMIVMVKNYF